MNEAVTFLLVVLAAYLFGSVPFAFLIGASRGVDLRKEGSGNIGAGNLTRTVGIGAGAAAAVLDGLKGLIPVLICRRLGLPPSVTVSSGVAAVAGHNWSAYLGGRGGRGLATSSGAIVALAPVLAVWTGMWAITGWRIGGGMAGFLGWGLLPVFASITGQPAAVVAGSAALALLMVIRRIQASPGREPGGRAALTRAIWDTDRVPELESADEVVWR